ncbi:MAG: hypothetical protein ABR506_05405 [Candidatus Krumholzibacteriia bacterium]
MRRPWRRRPRPFAGRDFLDLVPAPAVGAEADPETGDLVVLLPRFRDRVLGRVLQPSLPAARRYVRVRLDARGSVLWRAMDGQRDIRALVPVYEEAFPEDRTEAAERVCKWFYAGYESGLLTLGI